MALPGNWTIEEILTLSYYRGINTINLKELVENSDSLPVLLNSSVFSKYASKLKQNSIFENTTSNITDLVNRQLDICSQKNYKIISYWDERYPLLLKEIPYSPILLFVWGDLQPADSASISIVGTRKCTNYGKLTTEDFATCFVRNSIIISSGLAYGIDTFAHLSTSRAKGITYAVIASGLDEISPMISHKNAEKIVDGGGAIISEYKCGTIAKPGYFPQRNRIISGISKATLVIESGLKGGALITARFALDQNREVFAVPGNIHSEKSQGTNALIKKNIATLALSPEALLIDLGFAQLDLGKESKANQFSSKEEEIIFNSLDHEPRHIDELMETANMDISELLVSLLNMEFNGLVRQLPGKYYIRG
jgi:DNA processing protein